MSSVGMPPEACPASRARGSPRPRRRDVGGPVPCAVMTDRAPNAYSTLPSEGPYDAAIGAALITMVEPHPGHEAAYNRWYEDDHFYAGAMAMPWMFAGRRWVATRELQQLRFPDDSLVAQPASARSSLSVY